MDGWAAVMLLTEGVETVKNISNNNLLEEDYGSSWCIARGISGMLFVALEEGHHPDKIIRDAFEFLKERLREIRN